MNAMTVELSAENRGKVREALKEHPQWNEYRRNRQLDFSTMRKVDYIEACNDLQIDLASVIPTPADAPRQEAPKTIGPRIGATLLDAPQAAKAVTPAPAATNDKAAQLAALLTDLASQNSQPVDMEQVRALVDEKADRLADTMFSMLAKANDEFRETVAGLLADMPAVRIEVRKGDEVRAVDGHKHPQLPKLLRAASSRMANGHAPAIWIAGPAGSGKTHAAHTVAQALGLAYHFNGAISMPHELLGFIDAAGTYHRTPFRDAYEHGGVYLFDEVDGSDNSALLALNAALANGKATFPDGQIERHADCVIIATANTWGLGATADYVGRSKIDAAFLSRFPVRLTWDYDEKLEQAICGNADFAKRVQKARAKARAAGIKVLIDPRASQAGAALIAAGMSADEAAEMTFLANLTADQRKIVEG